MAIKIIKEGKIKKFRKTCPDCGCEFEYEASDLSTDYSVCLTTYPPKYTTYIVCPCCRKHLHHGYTTTTTTTISSYPNTTYTTTATSWPDCDTCPFKPDPNKVVVGDTPCTRCKKRQPYCVSDGIICTSASTSYTVNPKDFNVSTYTTSSYTSPDFTANYTTTPELNKQAACEYTIDTKE